jgi:hypothetical protein
MEDVTKLYEELIDLGMFTNEELELVTNINGYSVDTLNDCIYSRYGFHSLKQYLNEDEEDNE